jgi:hypothetical protein
VQAYVQVGMCICGNVLHSIARHKAAHHTREAHSSEAVHTRSQHITARHRTQGSAAPPASSWLAV